jgi:hypothetical protein
VGDGLDVHGGTFAIVSNCRWNCGAGKQYWDCQNPALPSHAIIVGLNGVLIGSKPPQATGTNWTDWSTQRTHVMGSGLMQAGGHNGGNGAVLTNGSLSFCYADIRMPENASFGNIEVVHFQASSSPATLRLAQRTINFSSPGAATETWPVSVSGPASSGYKLTTLNCTGVSYAPSKEYRLLWVPGHVNDTFEGWRMVNWKDRGTQNHF